METPTKEAAEKEKELIHSGVDGDADNGKEERRAHTGQVNTLPTEKEKDRIPRRTETPVATPTKEKKKLVQRKSPVVNGGKGRQYRTEELTQNRDTSSKQ